MEVTKTIRKKLSGIIQSYFLITIGLFIYAFAWTAFLIPSQIISGGISGLSAIIFFGTGFPYGVTTLIINAGLVLLAIRILGAKFAISSIYGIVVLSFFLIVLQGIIKEPFTKDQFMAALIGGILGGAGIGLAFINGGNTGGTDIIALIVTKYKNTSPGRVIMVCDFIIIGSSFIVFRSIEKIVYGYVVMAVMAYTLDLLLEGAKQSYQFTIISSKSEEIANRITTETGRGVTLLNGMGWYTKKDRDVLIVIARKNDKTSILKIVNETDKRAFLSVAKVEGVFGENFERIKI